jgi:hypothetical protein
MIQGNILGLMMFVFAGIFVAIGAFLLKLPDVIVMCFAGLVILACDLLFRFFSKREGSRFFAKQTGGYLFFIPAWVAGLAVITINITNYLINK